MFPSAHLVLFVNQDDYFRAVEDMLRRHPLYLSISYETDLLAMERIAPFASRWITFAGNRPDLLLELRTKSANYSAIRQIPPASNVILAWTLSPEPVVSRHEPLTPPLAARLKSMRQALDDGWKVRVCFDPLLHIDGWRERYGELVEQTFAAIPADQITDISIGVFRIPKDFLKNMRKQRTDSPLVHYPFVSRDGVMSYPDEIGRQLVSFVYDAVRRHVPAEKIFTE
jgi:spore photoproduct lyase